MSIIKSLSSGEWVPIFLGIFFLSLFVIAIAGVIVSSMKSMMENRRVPARQHVFHMSNFRCGCGRYDA